MSHTTGRSRARAPDNALQMLIQWVAVRGKFLYTLLCYKGIAQS